MDEENCWTTSEDTQKPLWQKEETCPLDNSRDKIFPSFELPL
jgi:hypothetical protein